MAYFAGAAISETLHAFMTYQVQARCPENPRYAFCNKDLSGSVIESNKPIHVFSGNVRSMVNGRSEYSGYSRDHLIEQMIPTNRYSSFNISLRVRSNALARICFGMANVPCYVLFYTAEYVHLVISCCCVSYQYLARIDNVSFAYLDGVKNLHSCQSLGGQLEMSST